MKKVLINLCKSDKDMDKGTGLIVFLGELWDLRPM